MGGMIILLYICPACAQATIGARGLAMGGAVTALPGYRWALFGNPAGLPFDRGTLSFFGVQYYGLPELTDMAASITLPAGTGALGAGFHRYGFELYRETNVRMGYKNRVKRFNFGLALHFRHLALGGGYGSYWALGIDLGFTAQITEMLWLASSATNINRPKFGTWEGSELPRSFQAGIAYGLSERVLMTMELVKDVRFPVAFRGGFEAGLLRHLFIRMGVTTGPETYSAGIGYGNGNWNCNIAVQRHQNPVLGFSPAIDFSLNW